MFDNGLCADTTSLMRDSKFYNRNGIDNGVMGRYGLEFNGYRSAATLREESICPHFSCQEHLLAAGSSNVCADSGKIIPTPHIQRQDQAETVPVGLKKSYALSINTAAASLASIDRGRIGSQPAASSYAGQLMARVTTATAGRATGGISATRIGCRRTGEGEAQALELW